MSIRFPESIKVDITVPENLDIEKVQVLIDTLRGLNKQDENKIDGVFHFSLQKAKVKRNDSTKKE